MNTFITTRMAPECDDDVTPLRGNENTTTWRWSTDVHHTWLDDRCAGFATAALMIGIRERGR